METVWIVCRCKDYEYYKPDRFNCDGYSEKLNFGKCYYWDYEAGMSPNKVDEDDFCSNGIRKDK